MVGTQVGNYLIEEKLGEGGMGTVYRALEIQLERRVAIKVLNADLARNQTIVERFRAEARAQANLMHPNIAVLYAFLVQDGNAMMVMEYIDGQNVQDIVRNRGPIQIGYAIPWFQQALAGIGAAHRLGIVHRDIKPSNLMITNAGVVKVLDFGIAKVAGGGRSLTSAGTKLGTVFYMSPEQVQAGAIDARSDIYSLGVTLYEMLTARVPFDSESDFTVQKDHVQSPPPLLTAFVPGIPKGVEKIVLKALEKRPEDRFQTVEEFSAALSNPGMWESYVPVFARGMGGPPRPRTVIEPQTPFPPTPFPPTPFPPRPQVGPPQPGPGPIYMPPIPVVKKSFWGSFFSDKRKVIGLAVVLLAVLAFLIFFKSGPTKALEGLWIGTCDITGKGERQTEPSAFTLKVPSDDNITAYAVNNDPFATGSYSGSTLTLHIINATAGFQLQVDLGAGTMNGSGINLPPGVDSCTCALRKQALPQTQPQK